LEPTSSRAPRDDAIGERRRARKARRSVLVLDRVAGWVISVGGLMVIAAVVSIMVFLVVVAAPLTTGGETLERRSYELDATEWGRTLWLAADEYRTLALRVAADGRYGVFHLSTGETVDEGRLDFGGQLATAAGGVVSRDQVAFGFPDGTVRFVSLDFEVDVLESSALPEDARSLTQSDLVRDNRVYSRLPGNQIRRIQVTTNQQDEPLQVSDAPISAIAYRVGGTAERPTRSFLTFDAEGVGRLSRAESKVNIMTSETTTELKSSTLPELPAGTEIKDVDMTTRADTIYAASAGGEIFRFDTRSFEEPVLAERVRAFEEGVTIGEMTFLVGEQALVVGGSNGEVKVFFKLQPGGTYEMVPARVHEPHGAPVTRISVSPRSKSFVSEAANGEVWVRHSTSDQVLFRYQYHEEARRSADLLMLPRVDGVLRVDDVGRTNFWAFEYPHPETTLRTIFGKVWYEGYSEPSYTWQSSSGTDVFEPKFSLTPLIFGTVKATVYAMLFALPVSLLGAIYTSEFVHAGVRATVKPIMEAMESLPTVVMGFIGALILAPIVESWIASVLLAFIVLPLGLMLAAFLWQMLPRDTVLMLDGLPKFFLMFVVILLAVYAAYHSGVSLEKLLFYGDFKGWLNGDVGTGTPFMFLVLLPLAYVLASWLLGRVLGPSLRARRRGMSRPGAGALDFARWAALLAAGAVLSYLVAGALTGVGYDPRGGVVDTYVQRNALVVGFVMGFAIIPNIYTLAEDALNSVPQHVRAASLAAGATAWQTAKWVILPTAMSGVFAACMIGMGRAVGETMIVVMAAGNTPVLEWNIFNGLRTLSANIAVELPEAAQGGTLYRMLFLAALTLFAMTFVINTVAEVIRQRFRRRAFQL
jgi:phosphate transport system permease protein